MNDAIFRATGAGQSLWLDDITRALLDQGALRRYMDDFRVSGLTSNPTIFDAAISGSTDYDAAIRSDALSGLDDESLFVELALQDLRRAADLLHPVFAATHGADGWVSMEVSPTLVDDAAGTLAAARRIFGQAARANLFVKIPGTPAGIQAIEAAIYAGIPVNVTLLFSLDQYVEAADAYLLGVERRLEAGLGPHVGSVASLFVSRWDRAVAESVPADLRNRLGIAIAGRVYHYHRQLLASTRWRRLADAGARPQRLLWASTGTKDPLAADTSYVNALVAPGTINTLPTKTLLAFADHGAPRPMADDDAAARATLARFAAAGVDVDALGERLQREGAQKFLQSWQHVLQSIAARRAALVAA
jgi:transaldolase